MDSGLAAARRPGTTPQITFRAFNSAISAAL
jgi:hypothetical protein